MKRGMALSVLVGVGTLSFTLQAARPSPPLPQGGQAPAPMVVEVEKLKDNLFMLRGNGGGGNTAVFVAGERRHRRRHEEPGWGQPILAKIRS